MLTGYAHILCLQIVCHLSCYTLVYGFFFCCILGSHFWFHLKQMWWFWKGDARDEYCMILGGASLIFWLCVVSLMILTGAFAYMLCVYCFGSYTLLRYVLWVSWSIFVIEHWSESLGWCIFPLLQHCRSSVIALKYDS